MTRPLTSRLRALVALGLALLAITGRARSAAPTLYHQPAHQSPVRGEPDDLLLIPGYGFREGDQIVYQAVEGPVLPSHPASRPSVSNATTGMADVVSYASLPYSLTARLPTAMRKAQSYSLWVVTANNEWSEPIRINDARPLWFSPAFAFVSQSIPSLGRYIKVIGRNLEPAVDATTEVRLLGPADVVLKAAPAKAEASALNNYVASAKLPARLEAGTYRVQIRRDRSGWVEVTGLRFEVRPDLPSKREFNAGDAAFGGCSPDDDADDAECLQRAIGAADDAGGGTVVVGPGTWNLSESSLNPRDGIQVPQGVTLRGAADGATVIRWRADGKEPGKALFTLLGGNVIDGITFIDEHRYTPRSSRNAVLQLGRTESQLPTSRGAQREPMTDVVITRNIFSKPQVAITDNGAAIARLVIANNQFGAYRSALELTGNRYQVNAPFGIVDSIISHNVFKPGSYFDAEIRQGTLASEVGASLRVDFSENIADGTATDQLYAPDERRGWRAGFFWHLNNNQEMLLVSQNLATCTGDEAGDGEAIAFDNNGNTFALAEAATVLRARQDSVTLAVPVSRRQNDRDILIENYYQGHWIQVGEGPGLGQVRKILSYREDRASGSVTFQVVPDWDVTPVAAQTRVNVGREFWQAYVVANTVDHRQPLCRKSNQTQKSGGYISIWAQVADSVVEGNRQFDTNGIAFQQYYNAEEESCSECIRATGYIDFLDIRSNLIDGEYAFDDDCSTSGILGSLAAGPTHRSIPTTVSYGLSIAHNTINRADGTQGGAITMIPTWFQGPNPHRWPLADNVLIFHNDIRGLNAPPARLCPGHAEHARTGISLGNSALAWRTVLYANFCADARRATDFAGAGGVVSVCPAGSNATCECRPEQ